MSEGKKRIEWIDIVKGIAIILIIIGHSLGDYSRSFLAAMIYAVHVPVFFILSGYLFRERKNILKYIKHMSLTLLLPYVFTGLLIVLLSVASWRVSVGVFHPYTDNGLKWLLEAVGYGIGGSGILPIAGKTFYPPYIGAIWFLLAMFFGNLMFNAVMILARKMSKDDDGQIWIVAVVSVLLCAVGLTLGENNIRLPWSLTASLVVQPFYLVGYVAKKHNLLGNPKPNAWLFILATMIWVLAALSGMFYVERGWATNSWSAMLGAVAGSYSLIYLAKLVERKFNGGISRIFKKYLITMGKFSMMVLCFHLIDLNNISIGWNIVEVFARNGMYIPGIILQIIYRIVFCSVICYLIPHILVVRSIFLYRLYPLL